MKLNRAARKWLGSLPSAIACIVPIVTATGACAQQNQSIVVRHQRCVFESLGQLADNSTTLDARLMEKAVARCEKLLQPLKMSIVSRTHDSAFAEATLEKIRRASARGAAVTLIAFLEQRTITKPKSGLLDQMATPAKPATPAAPGGMLDGIDPNAGGIQAIGGKP